ncbi:MAG: hypothetical protein QOC81_2973 [Thermoanaerobaculia bacterium]|jgi:hypothetical protein|nr:hypothetical protein [Thermoanaerobaculia bacterium]
MRTILLLILSLACSAASAQTTTQGPVTAVAAPPAELSTIVVPIHASLAPLLPQLESQVPKNLSKTDAWELDPRKEFGMKYRVVRDPIVLNAIGGGIHATTTIHFALQGCRRTKKPFTDDVVMWPCLSCGFGEPMRDAWISLASHLDWDANWRLRSTTRAMPVDYSSNRCQVTFANIDITDWKIAPIVREQLKQTLKTIDANTPKLTNIRPAAGQVWSALQSPVEIAPRTWLVMEPSDVSLGPITGSGLTVTSMLTLSARTRVVVGERPAVTPKALPALRLSQPGTAGGIRIPFNVELSYDEASRLMTENFGKRNYEGVAVDGIRITPAANGRVSIELNVDYRLSRLRHYNGPVYLEATPAFDATTRIVSLENLQYALESRRKNLFVRIADRFAHDTLRAQLAKTAHWSVAPQIDSIRGAIANAVTRPLASGVMMRGRVDAIELHSMTLDASGIIIHALAAGNAEVEIKAFR